MEASTQPNPTSDPLARPFGLEHAVELPVLGVRVRFESNSAKALTLVDESFGDWVSVSIPTHVMSSRSLRVRLLIGSDSPVSSGKMVRWSRLPDTDRLVVLLGGAVGIAEGRRRDAVVYANPRELKDREQFRYSILEAVTLFLVTQLDRSPVHAAAVVDGGSALLLAGGSGVGKSATCYAAVRAGRKILADEAVYLQCEPSLRLWGAPWKIRVSPSAKALFPELAGRDAQELPGGNQKIVIDVRPHGGVPELPFADRAGICLLSRGEDGPLCEPVDPAAAVAWITDHADPGFDLFTSAVAPALRKLADFGAWRLRIDRPPRDVNTAITGMLNEVKGE